MGEKTCRVTFLTGQGARSVRAEAGDNLLALARAAHIDLDAPCSGAGTCGKCRVRLRSGSLSMPDSRLVSETDRGEGWYLACRSTVTGDAEVEIPAAASAFRRGIRTGEHRAGVPSGAAGCETDRTYEQLREALLAAGIGWDSGFAVVEAELPAPTLDDPAPDEERLARVLAKEGYPGAVLTLPALRKLPEVLRAGGFSVRCVLEKREQSCVVYDVTGPGREEGAPARKQSPDGGTGKEPGGGLEEVLAAGLAIDLGTTTVAALLVDLLTGAVLARDTWGNAQIRYGADVITRIMESAKPGGAEALSRAVLTETIAPLAEKLCGAAGISGERILKVALAGNTTMEHLLLQVPADPIRLEPYVPAFFSLPELGAREAGFAAHPAARLILAPNIGSYVGGDITAGTLVSGIWNRPELSMLIDLGTNGELVLGNSEFLLACACSAGPAFEGGGIRCGMRATDGAIDACRIAPGTLEPSCRVIGGTRPEGLCGSGLIDAVSGLFAAGAINPKGRFVREGARIRRDRYGEASFVLATEEESADGRAVELSETDIDNFIRAKGAVFSAIRTMLHYLDMDSSMIEAVYVAGGIGNGLAVPSALSVGLFPNLPPERFHMIGNTSLAGAYAMLASRKARQKLREVAGTMTYLELSALPGYMDEFVAACFLPHTDSRMFQAGPGPAK